MRKIPRIPRGVARTAALALIVTGAGTAWAASPPTATATVSEIQLSPTTYQYSLTLNDALSSPSPIGTFWMAWVPGKDFLTTSPTSITSPAGWTATLPPTHGGSTDGYAIQWIASSASSDDMAGGSLSGFTFISTDAPSSVFGNSSFYPSFATLTSFAYDAAPFSDAGTQFVPTVVVTPEPLSLGILAPAALLLLRRRTARKA